MTIPGNPYLSLILRLVVGVTLVLASITKLPYHLHFVESVKSYHLLPDLLATAYALALPWFELVAGAYLILGILLQPAAVVTLLIGISFLVANVSAILAGEQYCSSCFGEAVPLLLSQAMALDALIIIAALVLLVGDRKELLSFDSWFQRRYCGTKAADPKATTG